MGDTILVTASLRIERPAADVRAQYRDVDHHIRNNVHPSIHYQWEAGAPGERKIRTTFRILGVPQYDVSLLEDAPDGSFLIRYLEGSNAGMVLVHEFVPLGPNATDVRLSANAPATVGRKLLGPLFVAGARQVMKKALAEDKRDLEGGSFVANVAAGNIEGALASIARVAKRDATDKRALLEVACLLAATDGDTDAAERDVLHRIRRLTDAESERGFCDARLQELAELGRTPRIADHAESLGKALSKADLVAEGVTAAAVVGLASEGLSAGELSTLKCVARAAGMSDDTLAATIENADAALSRR